MKRSLLWLFLLLMAGAATVGVMRINGERTERKGRPGIVSFTAEPKAVLPGQPVKLAWETQGASGVTLEWTNADHAGAVTRQGLPPSGNLTTHQDENTKYVLNCETVSGQSCGTARLIVKMRAWLTSQPGLPAAR